MAASYRIDRDQGVIFSHAAGVVTDDDLSRHQSTILADPAFDPGFHQIWDFQQVTQVSVTTALVRRLAQSRSYRPGVKRAFVAPADDAYGLARMFQALHEHSGEDVQVFRTFDEASHWLGLP